MSKRHEICPCCRNPLFDRYNKNEPGPDQSETCHRCNEEVWPIGREPKGHKYNKRDLDKERKVIDLQGKTIQAQQPKRFFTETGRISAEKAERENELRRERERALRKQQHLESLLRRSIPIFLEQYDKTLLELQNKAPSNQNFSTQLAAHTSKDPRRLSVGTSVVDSELYRHWGDALNIIVHYLQNEDKQESERQATLEAKRNLIKRFIITIFCVVWVCVAWYFLFQYVVMPVYHFIAGNWKGLVSSIAVIVVATVIAAKLND